MQKCKIISIKSLGKQKTYNVTMAGDQHNYKIVDKNRDGIYSKNSHSCAYSFISFQTGWLKYYYPIEFMCNLLTSEINNTDKDEKLKIYWQTATDKMDIGIYKTQINKSGHEFVIDQLRGQDIIRAPLTALKGVGSKAVDSIVKNQPYKNLEDFMIRTDARVVNSRVFTTLVNSGAMDEAWKVPRELILNQYENLKKKIDKEKKERAKQDKEKEKRKGKTLFDIFNGPEESELSAGIVNEDKQEGMD